MDQHVLIIGGGIAGPALALFLDKAGIRSTVFEAYDQAGDIGGGMQIAPNGMRVLNELGLADQIIASGVESDEFLFENHLGRALGLMSNGPAKKYGLPSVFVARSVVHRVLLGEADRRGIQIVYKKRLRQWVCDDQSVTALFEDESTAEGSLLVGADGIHSRSRKLMFPEGPRPVYTGLFTIGGFATHPILIPENNAHMHRARMVFGRNGFFAYGHFDRSRPDTVMWWSTFPRDIEDKENQQESLGAEELRQKLLASHNDWREPVRSIIGCARELLQGPVYDLPSLPAWSRERVILIGDAAHATSPQAGLGASLALEDAIILAKLLRDNRTDHEQMFQQFESVRRGRVERVIAEGRSRGDRMRTLSPAAAWIRDRVISALSRGWFEKKNDWMYSYNVTWEG